MYTQLHQLHDASQCYAGIDTGIICVVSYPQRARDSPKI